MSTDTVKPAIIREDSAEVADTIDYITKLGLKNGQARKLCHFVYKHFADKAKEERPEKPAKKK